MLSPTVMVVFCPLMNQLHCGAGGVGAGGHAAAGGAGSAGAATTAAMSALSTIVNFILGTSVVLCEKIDDQEAKGTGLLIDAILYDALIYN